MIIKGYTNKTNFWFAQLAEKRPAIKKRLSAHNYNYLWKRGYV